MHDHLPALKRLVLIGVIVPGILAILSGSWSCQEGRSEPVESISIGTTTSEVNSLILIAEVQGYFTGNGLNVNHKIYSSGIDAINGMLNSETDMATGSEFAFAGEVLSGKNIRTIGVINRSSVNYLVGRTDRGINSIPDLEGKRIGVPLGSRPQLALDRFMFLRGIDTSGVTLVDVPVNQSADALASGKVDAVTAWQPYIEQIKERMGNGLVAWSTQEGQPSYTLVMCRDKWTAENPDITERFLKSLVEAEGYVTGHPEQAKAIIREKLNYSEKYIASVWPDYRFSVLLDQSLVAAMEDQVRWMIRNNLAAAKETPNFMNYIYEGPLEKVKPEAANVIR